MPIDIKALRRHGVSSADYRKIFTADPADYPPRIKKLVDHISGRIREGRTLNLTEWRAFHAIDLAYDVPFNQTTPTLIQNILSKRYEKVDQVLAELRAWGLSEEDLFLKVPMENGQFGYMLNPPVFYNIFVPIVKAYCGTRVANLFNERNTNPFTPYEPLKATERDQVLCEIITDQENSVSTLFGYPAVLRQAIQQMIRYGIAIAFPREEWYCEKQLETDPVTGGEREIIIKEGLRYMLPHPTFMYYDLKFPLTTANTDTGIQFAGCWHVLSYGQILDNPIYWNRKKIFSGTNWFQSPLAGNLFTEVFPCSLKFPISAVGPMTREDKSAYYSTSSRDQAVFVTEHYEKLIPKSWGLADYKYPVWHRFTMAGDDTVIWAEPCAYNPLWFMGYDYDENAGRNASMALECIPWQDMLGNALSQLILTCKQNLTNVIFYDTNMVDADEIRKMQNLGEQRYRATNFIPYDSMKTRVQGLSAQNAFSPVQLSKTSIAELLQTIPTTLSIMERVLQVSAQEAGAQATHQQSKYELQQTGGASSNRVFFIGSSTDEGVDAWKRQRYDASMAYRKSTVSAQVSSDIPNVHRLLEELGFTVSHAGKEKLLVHGKKSGLRLEGFARSSQGRPPSTDREAAQVIFQIVQVVATQPALFERIGTKNVLSLLELGGQLSGAPRGLRLREAPEGQNNGQIPAGTMQAIQAAQQATLQAVQEKIGQPAAQEVAKVQGEIEQLQQVVKQLSQIFKVAQKLTEQNAQKLEDSRIQLQIDAEESKQTIQRKNIESAQEQQRKDAELSAKLAREEAETASKILNAEKESAAKVDAAGKEKSNGET
jgi:hypothetical protein